MNSIDAMASSMAHTHPHHGTSRTKEAPVTPPSSPQPYSDNDNALNNAFVSPLSRSAMLQSKKGSPPSPIDSPMADVETKYGGMTPPPSPIQSTPTLSRTIFSLADGASTQSFHTPGDIESTHSSKASSSKTPPTVPRSSKRSSDAAVLDFINAYTRDTSSISQPSSTFPLYVLAHQSIQAPPAERQASFPVEIHHPTPLLERNSKRLGQSPKLGCELSVTDNGSPIRPNGPRRQPAKRNRPCATSKRRRALEVSAPPVPPLPKLDFVPPINRIPLRVGPQRKRTKEEIQAAIQSKPLPPNPPFQGHDGEYTKRHSEASLNSVRLRESSVISNNVLGPQTIRVVSPTQNENPNLRTAIPSATSTETPTSHRSTIRNVTANREDSPPASSSHSSNAMNYYGLGGEAAISHFDHDDDEEGQEFLKVIKRTWKKQTARVKTTALELQQRLNREKEMDEEESHPCTDDSEGKWQKRLTIRLTEVKSKVTDSLRSCFGREEVVGYV